MKGEESSLRIPSRNSRTRVRTIIMIEHDFSNLEMADTIYLLDSGRLSEFDGELK